MAILVTDGQSTMHPELLVPNAYKAHDQGIHIVCVGIGDFIAEEELLIVASEPSEDNVILIDDFDGLNFIIDNLMSQTCPVEGKSYTIYLLNAITKLE